MVMLPPVLLTIIAPPELRGKVAPLITVPEFIALPFLKVKPLTTTVSPLEAAIVII